MFQQQLEPSNSRRLLLPRCFPALAECANTFGIASAMAVLTTSHGRILSFEIPTGQFSHSIIGKCIAETGKWFHDYP